MSGVVSDQDRYINIPCPHPGGQVADCAPIRWFLQRNNNFLPSAEGSCERCKENEGVGLTPCHAGNRQ